MLLNFQLGENCPCPGEIQEELYDFHEDLLIHCGELLPASFGQDESVSHSTLEAGGGWEISFLFKIKMLIVQEMVLSNLLGSEKLEEGILAYVTETPT